MAGSRYTQNFRSATRGGAWLERTLTRAEILALFDTPIVLLAAPGAGLAWVPMTLILSMDFNSVVYTVAGDLTLRVGGIVKASLASVLDLTEDTVIVYPGMGVDSVAMLPNKSIDLKAAVGNPTLGNSELKVKLFYKLVAI
jgi:hypothetical protein